MHGFVEDAGSLLCNLYISKKNNQFGKASKSEADNRIQIYPTAVVSITVRLHVNQFISEWGQNMRDILAVIMLDKDGSTVSSVQNRKEGNSSDAAVTVRWAGISAAQMEAEVFYKYTQVQKSKHCPAHNVMTITQRQTFHRRI